MQNQTSSLILTFGPTDPVCATGILADQATFSAMGCRGAAVVTALLQTDTTGVHDSQSVESEWVSDQARTILEDMPVAAFKVGLPGSIENIAAIAEIVADYPEIPLILDPLGTINTTEDDLSQEDYLLAIRELLIPQGSLLVLSSGQLRMLAETWRPAVQHDMLQDDVRQLTDSGCAHVLVTDTNPSSNDMTNILFDEHGILHEGHWPRPPGSFTGAGAALSAGIAALMGAGVTTIDACTQAQEFTNATLVHAQRLGMGRLVPDYYFWTSVTQATSNHPTTTL